VIEFLRSLDVKLLLSINGLSSPAADIIFWQLSLSWHVVVVCLLSAFYFYRKCGLKKAALFILTCIFVISISDITSNVFKKTVKRFRPTHQISLQDKLFLYQGNKGGKFGFYSAHASNTFAFTMIVYLCFNKVRRNKKNILFFIYPILVSLSRVYMGLHYPSDVFAGALLGMAIAWVTFFYCNKYFLKLDENRF